MKLKEVEIVNFRSVENITVDFQSSCRILVGINESGKSNILKALSTISPDYQLTIEDIREPLSKEKSIKEAYIYFIFKLEKKEIDKIYSEIKPKILTNKIKELLIRNGVKKYSLKDFCNNKDEGIFKIDVFNKSKYETYWSLPKNYEVFKKWKRPSEKCPADFKIQLGEEQVLLKNYSLLNIEEYNEIPDEYVEDVDAKYVNKLIGEEINKIVKESLPKVIFWKYDESNLLPPNVDIDAFSANPNICIPLKNMFILAGIKEEDIASEIRTAKEASLNKLRNLLKRIATHTTKHFKSVWKDYKSISFALEPNGNIIEPNIVEENHWKMSQRSDGIKRFITFLLHISANVKADVLNNAIILVDEPDMGLHPTGSTHLKNELIEISKKNYVVFSTHSIFMIDKENIGRHIIVKKELEKTEIKNASKSNFVDEEVLFNALNYTVFDIIKKDNIIFEGWRDKKLFQVALNRIPSTHNKEIKPLKDKINFKIGLCHADGVKDVRNITPLLELADRNCIIISDTDVPAKEKQKEYQEINGYGEWKRYDEVCKGCNAETGEDFLKEAFVKKYIEKTKKDYNIKNDPVINSRGRINNIKAWMAKEGISVEDIKKIVNELKTNLFNDLKAENIDTSYYDFLKDLSSLVSNDLIKK